MSSTREGECEGVAKQAERAFVATTAFWKTMVTFSYSLVSFCIIFYISTKNCSPNIVGFIFSCFLT